MKIKAYENKYIEVFELVLQTTPKHFGDWLSSELMKTFPRGLLWNDEINNLCLGGELVSPDPEDKNQHQQYLIHGFVMDESYRPIRRIPLLIQFELRILNDESIQGICKSLHHYPLLEYIAGLQLEIERIFKPIANYDSLQQTLIKESEPTKPARPEKPVGHATWTVWFDYFQAMKDTRFKYTLAELAKDMGYSYGYVRQMHRNYLAMR